MPQKTSDKAYEILGFFGNAFLSKTGAITFCYFLDNPACYSLTENDFDSRNKDFFRAFKYMGDDTYVHKQDLFLRKGFDSQTITGDSFISRAERLYFDGKNYLDHICVLTFTLSGLKSLESSYISNPLKYDESLTAYDKQRLNSFQEEVKSAVTIIGNIQNTKISPISQVELKLYLLNYCTGFYGDGCIRDLITDENIYIGSKKGGFFALCEAEYLPDEVSTYIKDESLANANVTLYASMLERLGVHLKATHIVNQMWHFNSSYKGELAVTVKKFGQHKGFDKEIARDAELLDELEKNLVTEGNIICETHFNIYILEEEEVYNRAAEQVKSLFKIGDFKCFIPSFEGLEAIYLGSSIGCVNKLNPKFWFRCDLKSSLCLMLNYTTFKPDPTGVFFNERLYNTPFRIDLWHAPQGNKLPARNGIVISSTGGGKSVFTNNIVQQYIELGVKLVVVEFGKSFYQLTQLYPDISLHVDYDSAKPLGINPFALVRGEKPSNEKINTLVNIILKFWRSKEIKDDARQVVSLREILKDYYEYHTTNHSFPDFYEYVKNHSFEILQRCDIAEEYFDVQSFIHVCKEFIKGGFYENVCKTSELGEQIEKKDFIVFELTQIKKDPFLVSVIMSILLDVIETKLLDRSVKGMLVFDEYAEVQTIKDGFDGNSIHSTVAFCYQKLRKENSGVMTVIQSPSQLSDDEYSKGIIANTQLLYVLPTNENVYDSVIKTFSIKNQAHINLMKSIRNNFSGQDKYSEVFMRFGDLYAMCARLQLSPQKFMAFQTDGDFWKELQNQVSIYGIEQAINKMIEKQ